MMLPSSLGRHGGDDGEVPDITVLAGGQRVRIAGEVDMSSLARLRSCLAAVPPGPGQDLHLHLAGLRFIDVAGARELVLLAQAQPRRLVLHDPPRTLRRLIFLLWPDAKVEIREGARPAGPRPDPAERMGSARPPMTGN